MMVRRFLIDIKCTEQLSNNEFVIEYSCVSKTLENDTTKRDEDARHDDVTYGIILTRSMLLSRTYA